MCKHIPRAARLKLVLYCVKILTRKQYHFKIIDTCSKMYVEFDTKIILQISENLKT